MTEIKNHSTKKITPKIKRIKKLQIALEFNAHQMASENHASNLVRLHFCGQFTAQKEIKRH